MKPNPTLRELVRLMRAANDGDADAGRELDERARTFRHSHAALDADAAIAELLDVRFHVSPELRLALAQWIDGRIALKRGRKAAGVKRAARACPRLPPLAPGACIRALLAFGSTSEPAGVHPNTRRALAELLTGARQLRRGPRMAPAEALRTHLAALAAGHYRKLGLSWRAAIQRAEREATMAPGTLQRYIYPRKVR